MARPAKSLLELVREGTFRARRHHELLAGEDLQWRSLSKLQAEYRAAGDLFTKRRIAVRFENAVPELHARQQRSRKSLEEVLDGLGPPQSAERVVNFFPRFFRHYAGPKAGQRFRLEGFQERYVREFFRRDKHGRRIYTFGFFGIPKGNGKTPFAVGLGTEALMDPPAAQVPEVFGLAGARKQASLGQKFVAYSIEHTELGNFLRKSGSTISCPETGGTYELLSAEGELSHGVNGLASVIDEWWQFRHRSQREGFNALLDAVQKRPGEAWVQAISQAYYDFNSMMAERHQAAMAHPKLRLERDGCLAILEDEESGFLMHWYGAPADADDIDNLDLISACNPLSTLDPRDIRKLLLQPGADEADWRRLHLNQPTKGEHAWVPAGVWAALREEKRVRIPAGAGIFVAVDAAYSGDTTAVVYAWRDSRGRVHVRARIWSTEAQRRFNRAHVYVRSDTLDNEALVLPFIRELAGKYAVREIVFDPEYFVNEAKKLAQMGFTIAPVYPQSKEMSDAVRDTKKAIDDGKVSHDGDVELAAHVGNAIAKKRYYGTHEFSAIDKPTKHDRIDGATSMCMAVWRALRVRAEGFVGGVEFAKPAPAQAEPDAGFSGGAA